MHVRLSCLLCYRRSKSHEKWQRFCIYIHTFIAFYNAVQIEVQIVRNRDVNGRKTSNSKYYFTKRCVDVYYKTISRFLYASCSYQLSLQII